MKENTKAILQGEELWKSTPSGTHYDLTRGDGDDQYKIECKSNKGILVNLKEKIGMVILVIIK